MARYDITSLNYINVGTNRVFFNFDSQINYTLKKDINRLRDEENSTLIGFTGIEKYIITENEEQKLLSEDDKTVLIEQLFSKTGKFLGTEDLGKLATEKTNLLFLFEQFYRQQDELVPQNFVTYKVMLSNDNLEYDREISKFNSNRITLNNTYIGEFSQKDNKNIFNISNTQYIPMYNMIDVSIKSSYDTFYQNLDVDSDDTYTNIYTPDLLSNPIQFCQVNYETIGNTFMLTPTTKYDVYKLESSLAPNKKENGLYYNDIYSIYHDMQLAKKKSEILTYIDLSSTECDSYGEYLSTQNVDPINMFDPKKSIINTERNYLLKFPVSDIITNYKSGNVNAEIFPCKNHLNSTYEMELTDNTLTHGRQYCGINSSGNVVYLKYYDNCNYNLIKKNSQNGIEVIDAVNNSDDEVPYQKIESFYKVSFTNKRRHKSNLFSIRISDLGDLSEVSNEKDEMLDKVRGDLQSAINDIVNNICPVNTQLFKVYFGLQ